MPTPTTACDHAILEPEETFCDIGLDLPEDCEGCTEYLPDFEPLRSRNDAWARTALGRPALSARTEELD